MKQPYKVVREVISPDTLDLLKNTLLLTKNLDYYEKNISKHLNPLLENPIYN